MQSRQLVKRSVAAVSALIFALSCKVVLAQDAFGKGQLDAVAKNALGADYTKRSDLTAIIGQLVKTAIALLGIIFLILIVYAGYLWLTARGDEKQVTKAKDTLQRAMIGIVIVVSAYAIATFLFTRLTAAPAVTP